MFWNQIFSSGDKTEKAFPFLSLPRELRDEVYSYILLLDVPEEPFSVPVPLFNHPVAETSLLYVNRQIHDEAAEFLYSRNTFSIQIVVQGGLSHSFIPVGSDEHEDVTGYRFFSEYSSVWERFCHNAFLPYGFHEFSEARAYEVARNPSIITCETHDPNSRAPPIPALRHCRHFRNLQINILDFKRPRLLRHPLTVPDYIRSEMQTTYQPLVHHLKPILSSAGEHLNVAINIVSIEHTMQTGRNVVDELPYWKKYAEGRALRPSTSHHSDQYYFPVYEDLLRMAWPFTTGPWKAKVKTPMDEVFGHRIQPILDHCNQNALLDRSIMEFKPYFLASGCSWVFKRGRRCVAKLYASDADGICRDIDGNIHKL
ncbi:hypothetical protein TWF481_000723 [Arthrobotrys musiformis]|uniref:Uncharacterized protein n=1 Tax=Arthrobotrys musiformis TaxID=47236 RepID=A0AAV9WPL0_9PEZI